MKVLMVGLGSIGQRHLRNMHELYGDNIEFIAYRVRGLTRTFSDDMQIKDKVNLESEYNIKCYSDLDNALKAENPDIAFITNITAAHVDCAIKAANSHCDLFIEKPLSDSMRGLSELNEIIERNKLIAYVGFQNRYHPCLVKLKELLDGSIAGNIISVYVEVGERLTTIHPYEDYHNTYMARKDMGGGLILNLAIHEIDYINWIFGVPTVISAISNKNNDLNIDVDDNFITLLSSNFKGREVPICLKADFYQFPPKRYCKVVGTNGVIEADLLNFTIMATINDVVTKYDFSDFVRNDMFKSELNAFFNSVKSRCASEITYADGVNSMEVALNIITSLTIK